MPTYGPQHWNLASLRCPSNPSLLGWGNDPLLYNSDSGSCKYHKRADDASVTIPASIISHFDHTTYNNTPIRKSSWNAWKGFIDDLRAAESAPAFNWVEGGAHGTMAGLLEYRREIGAALERWLFDITDSGAVSCGADAVAYPGTWQDAVDNWYGDDSCDEQSSSFLVGCNGQEGLVSGHYSFLSTGRIHVKIANPLFPYPKIVKIPIWPRYEGYEDERWTEGQEAVVVASSWDGVSVSGIIKADSLTDYLMGEFNFTGMTLIAGATPTMANASWVEVDLNQMVLSGYNGWVFMSKHDYEVVTTGTHSAPPNPSSEDPPHYNEGEDRITMYQPHLVSVSGGAHCYATSVEDCDEDFE